jgi:hypothetical protein
MTPQEVVRFFETHRFLLSDEKALQRAIADEMEEAGITFDREVDLGDGDIIDFMVGDVGIEVKIQGQRRAIYRQCVRYCEHNELVSLVLATNAAMGMPAVLSGKPVFVANLGKAWL